MIKVDRNRLVRGSVVLTAVGVSQRDVTICLEELLDTERFTTRRGEVRIFRKT